MLFFHELYKIEDFKNKVKKLVVYKNKVLNRFVKIKLLILRGWGNGVGSRAEKPGSFLHSHKHA